MRKILFILVILLCSASFASERILSFNSKIIVNKDASIWIQETITVQAEETLIKTGISRDFPTIHQTKDGKTKRVGFKVIEVMRDGKKEPYHIEKIKNGRRIFIGKENRFIPAGKHTYTIVYETNRQIRYFENFDELHWNVTGTAWKYPIDKATATIKLPDGVKVYNSYGYTGYLGKNGQDYKIYGLSFETTRPLKTKEGFTIAATFPKGAIAHPSDSSFFLEDNLGLVVNIGILFILLGYYIWAWHHVGRDPDKGAIIPRFTPPQNFSPAQVRELLKMDVDKKCFTSAIINMAVQGVLKIREIETVGMLGAKEFALDKISDDTTKLAPEEKEAFNILFKDGNTIELSKKRIEQIRTALDMFHIAITEDKKEMFTQNGGYFLIGLLITVLSLVAFATITLDEIPPNKPAILIITIIGATVLLNPIFAFLLKAPSETGRKMMDEIEGFKMFLKTTEKHSFDKLNPPEKTPELFEKYLPYAIALDVENNWGKQFEEGEAYYPSWYVGNSMDTFSSSDFAHSISSTLFSAVTTSTTASGSCCNSECSGGRSISGW